MKIKPVSAVSKTASIAAPKLPGPRWKLQMSWQNFAEGNYWNRQEG